MPQGESPSAPELCQALNHFHLSTAVSLGWLTGYMCTLSGLAKSGRLVHWHCSSLAYGHAT